MRIVKVAFVLVLYVMTSLIGGFIGIVSTPDYSYADGQGADPPITDTVPDDTTGHVNSYLLNETQEITQADLYWDLLTFTLTVLI